MPGIAGQQDEPAQTDMPKLLRLQPRQIRRSYCSYTLTSSQCSWIPFHASPASPASPAAATAARAPAAARSHAGGATVAAGARTRSIETVVPPSESVPVSPSAARDVAASNAIRAASARAIGPSGSSPPGTGQIAALPTYLLPGVGLTVAERVTTRRSPESVSGRPVTIRSPTPMLRVVLPSVAATCAPSRKS